MIHPRERDTAGSHRGSFETLEMHHFIVSGFSPKAGLHLARSSGVQALPQQGTKKQLCSKKVE